MSQVNSLGHGGTVRSPNHTFSWASLNKRLTSTSCTYFRLSRTTTLLEWFSGREENYHRNYLMINPHESGTGSRTNFHLCSAVRLASVGKHVTDCATWPSVCKGYLSSLIWVQSVCKGYLASLIWVQTVCKDYLSSLIWVQAVCKDYLSSLIWVQTVCKGYLSSLIWIQTICKGYHQKPLATKEMI